MNCKLNVYEKLKFKIYNSNNIIYSLNKNYTNKNLNS